MDSNEEEDNEKANSSRMLRDNQAHRWDTNRYEGVESEDEEEESDYGVEDKSAGMAVTMVRTVCWFRALCSNSGRTTG